MRNSAVCFAAASLLLSSSLLESAMSFAGQGPADWFTFAAYPQARQLCRERVHGAGPRRMEIEWLLFATADAPQKVIAFYEREEKSKAKRDEHGAFSITSKSAARDKMSIIPTEKAQHYPHCKTKAADGDKTVILVSRAIGG
jgi:hypothetical protein